MEINKYRDITGVQAGEDIVEGKMVIMYDHGIDHDFGSRTDLPLVRVPTTAEESTRAHFCITWAVDNAVPPLYRPYPSYSYALRYGFDQAANSPFAATVLLTQPSMTECTTIPSGALALAFQPGTFTVASCAFVPSAEIQVPGAWLEVCNTADDGAASAGKWKYAATVHVPHAFVERYDTTNHLLTFRLE